MTATPDFAAIIEDVLNDQFNCTKPGWYSEDAAAILAAAIAAMCPDCKGTGKVYDLRCDNCGGSASLPFGMTCSNHLAKPTPCYHPNAPTVGGALTEWADLHQRAATNGHTIGQALKVYEAVMGAEVELVDPYDDTAAVHVPNDPLANIWADDLLDALRSVAR